MAVKPKGGGVTLNVTVTLPESSWDFLEKNAKGDPAGTLTQWVTYYLDRQARGGLMLEPEDHDHLAEMNQGMHYPNSRTLCRAVERGMNRDKGQFRFGISIDPAYIQPIQEFAAQSNMTPEELVQNAANMIWASNWLYELTPENGRMIPFTKRMIDMAASASGKSSADVTSSDIERLIERAIQFTPEKKAA